MLQCLSYDYYKNAGGSKSKEEYFDEWKEILDSYTDSDTIILFSSTTIEDRKTTEEFSKKYVWQKSCVSFPDTVDEYWSQLEDVDYVISGRMHAMILAMQQDAFACHMNGKINWKSSNGSIVILV